MSRQDKAAEGVRDRFGTVTNLVVLLVVGLIVAALLLVGLGLVAAVANSWQTPLILFPPLLGLFVGALSVAALSLRFRRGSLRLAALSGLAAVGLVAGMLVWDARREVDVPINLSLETSFDRPFGPDSRIRVLSGPPAKLLLPRDGLPHLDGQKDLYRLYSAFVTATWPELPGPEIDALVQGNGPEKAFERLMAKEADLIFVASGSQLQDEPIRASGIHLTPIGHEALVFYVAAQNPVTGLTQDQIRSIYAGRVPYWQALGGPPVAVLAFQQKADSDKQPMLTRIMGETAVKPAPAGLILDGRDSIIRHRSDYRKFPGTIGYALRPEVAQGVGEGFIRLLAIDGITPTLTNIADGSYPFTTTFYAASLGPPQGAARVFVDWITSPEGQDLVARSGYVPLSPP